MYVIYILNKQSIYLSIYLLPWQLILTTVTLATHPHQSPLLPWPLLPWQQPTLTTVTLTTVTLATAHPHHCYPDHCYPGNSPPSPLLPWPLLPWQQPILTTVTLATAHPDHCYPDNSPPSPLLPWQQPTLTTVTLTTVTLTTVSLTTVTLTTDYSPITLFPSVLYTPWIPWYQTRWILDLAISRYVCSSSARPRPAHIPARSGIPGGWAGSSPGSGE